jgi:oligosaccharide 4-alpha-D-glucosyltransferase
MQALKLSLVFLFIGLYSLAQSSKNNVISSESTTETFSIKTDQGVYHFAALKDNIIETVFVPTGESLDSISHAVILDRNKQPFTVQENANSLQLTHHEVKINIQKSPLKIDYYFEGQLIISDVQAIKNETTRSLNITIDNSEKLYGGGARALGMNRRGNKLALYNKAHYGYEYRSEQMNFCMPLVLSSKKYILHFDNSYTGSIDLAATKSNTVSFEPTGGPLRFQLVMGEDWAHLLASYTALTGTQPIPPRWAFGNFASRFGYHSQAEVTKVVNTFKKDSIPLDAVILDLYWFGKEIQGTLGNLGFYSDSFPEPEKMMRDFSNMGVKTVLITEPFILTTSKRWNEAKSFLAKDALGNPFTYDFYFGNTGLIDIYNPASRDWFWGIYKNLKKQGMNGIWGDLGEPEVHPENLIHAVGKANKVHNIYGHDWARMIQTGYNNEYPTERPFILMRAGYSGSQRFGMIPWSGDVNRSWGGLAAQPEIALQMGMQGMAYMHSDLGGFAGDYNDEELYIRWLQYGVFQPIFRPHSQEQVASEAIFKTPETKEIVKKAIELRYELLPYNYSIAFENQQTGMPLMRPLFFEDNNESLLSASSSYFWGPSFLVSPVLEKGQTTQNIYFPGNTKWFDFYSTASYQSGDSAIIALNKNYVPTFVKGGAFVPMTTKIQNTESLRSDAIIVHYYFDETVCCSAFDLYEDDGKTPDAYSKGKYKILHLSQQTKHNKLSLIFTSEIGAHTLFEEKNVTIIVHGVKKAPKKCTMKNAQIIDKTYYSSSQTMEITIKTTKVVEKIQMKW